MKRSRQTGFTLIEVLVSLAVFGVLTALAYATLGQTLSNADLLTDRMERLEAIQRAVRILDGDLLQAAPRPIRDPLTEIVSPAVLADPSHDYALEVTRTGWNNPAGLPRSTQQRAAYRVEDDELVRYHWIVLDRTLANEPLRTVLLDDVESLQMQFLGIDGEWSVQWPGRDVVGYRNPEVRPRAVQYTLTLFDEGELRRVVEVTP